tara:strand:+ start:315 stop:743 length:429 start_codon:yes stop_codon:yes gene_type:complete
MNQDVHLTEIGSEVTVDLPLVKDRIPDTLEYILNKNPKGKVVGYKMTDGMGIGLILELDNGIKSWFFDEEIKESQERSTLNRKISVEDTIMNDQYIQKIEGVQKIIVAYKNSRNYFKQSKVSELINPSNFIQWFLYSTKDIF